MWGFGHYSLSRSDPGPLSAETVGAPKGKAGSTVHEDMRGLGRRHQALELGDEGLVDTFQAWNESFPPGRGSPNSFSIQEQQAEGAHRVRLKFESLCFALGLMDLNVTFPP